MMIFFPEASQAQPHTGRGPVLFRWGRPVAEAGALLWRKGRVSGSVGSRQVEQQLWNWKTWKFYFETEKIQGAFVKSWCLKSSYLRPYRFALVFENKLVPGQSIWPVKTQLGSFQEFQGIINHLPKTFISCNMLQISWSHVRVCTMFIYVPCLYPTLPGYVTEKIVNAFLAGCIPIYWGSRLISSTCPLLTTDHHSCQIGISFEE